MSGELTAVKKDDWIELNFPATPVTKSTTPEGLIKALGEKPVFIGLNKYDCLAQFASDQAVRDLKPDFGALKRVSVRGMITTAADSTGEYDFISRFFAPAVGIDEDPVTGSAHCALTPFWAERLSKSELTAFQASRRGGVLRLLNDGDRVRLSGQAVTVMRGELV